MTSGCFKHNAFERLFAYAIARLGIVWCSIVLCPQGVLAQAILPAAAYPVGMVQVEFIDPAEGGRPLDYMLIYPAAPESTAAPFKMFMATNLHLYKDAPIVSD